MNIDDSCKTKNQTTTTTIISNRKDNTNINKHNNNNNNNNMPDVDDSNMQWFHGKITREEAEALLTPREVIITIKKCNHLLFTIYFL